jgi:hypothetical protein
MRDSSGWGRSHVEVKSRENLQKRHRLAIFVILQPVLPYQPIRIAGFLASSMHNCGYKLVDRPELTD